MSQVQLKTRLQKTVSVPSEAISLLVAEGNGDAALAYLCMLADPDDAPRETLQTRFGWEQDRLSSAVRTLLRLNLVEEVVMTEDKSVSGGLPKAPPEREMPEYSANDIIRAVEGREEFRLLVQEAQRRLGKILSNADLAILFGLYDYLGLPAEVLYLLVGYCIEESARRYGSGRKPTLRQIEKEGYIWARRGIDTEERAAAHIKYLELLRSDVYKIMGVLQLSGRAPTRPEERYIRTWLEMGFASETVEIAYEKTVLKCKELNWNYLNSILKNWHEKNLHRPEDVLKTSAPASAKKRFDGQPQEINRRRDIDQMKQYLKRMKEEL